MQAKHRHSGFLFRFNKTCNMRNKFCVVSSISMFRSFPVGYITSTYTRVDLSCPQPLKNTTQESVGATAAIVHPFDWHGPTLLAIRLQCDEDTIEAIRRDFALLQCFTRRTRHVCYPVDEDNEEDGKQADHSALKKLITGDSSPVLTTTSSRRFLSKEKLMV